MIKEKLAALLNVKSIVTLILTLVFAVLSITGRLSPEQLQTAFTTVLAFYFGTQSRKKEDENHG